MQLNEYFLNQFQKDLRRFISKSAWVHTHYLSHSHNGELDELSIPIGELERKNLHHIGKNNLEFFACSLAFVVLLDQLMYTYFKQDYPKFRKLTMYPKLELGITGHNLYPWSVFDKVFVQYQTFKDFAIFFINRLQAFFDDNQFTTARWASVKNAMITDATISTGKYSLKSVFDDLEQESFLHS